MINSILSLKLKVLRTIREEGWVSLCRKTLRKINRRIKRSGLKQPSPITDGEVVEVMQSSNDKAKRWLENNRNNYSNPFYMLLKYLLVLTEQLKDVVPVSCADYEK